VLPSSPNSCNQQKTSSSHNAPFLSPWSHCLLKVQRKPHPPPLDEKEGPQWSDKEEAERWPIRVVVDTSSDDSEFVEQNEIQDHVPLKHCTPRKSARGTRGDGRRSTATRRGTVVSKHRHHLSSSLIHSS
jgi:hypothetical protein